VEQNQIEITKLLQQKIFSHPSITRFNSYSRAVFDKLSKCHTSKIGVHQYRCNNTNCNHVHYQYHSCGNRHCPTCGGMRREAWIEDRMSELLPTQYFHIVFTLPQELRSITMGNRKLMFELLFQSAHYTLIKLGHDPRWLGAQLGIVSILHTHGQDLSFHPHIHCIVSGGGVTKEGNWLQSKRSKDRFIFPRRVMEKIYKAHFLKQMYSKFCNSELQIENAEKINSSIESVRYKKWNVYSKAPFRGPSQIIAYLGRYTHKVAITAHRIKRIDDEYIKFQYKDYADNGKEKEMTLSHIEFARRYEQHILPRRFVKIRHAGYLSHRGKNERIAKLHNLLKLPPPMPKVEIPIQLRVLIKTGIDISLCPICKTGKLILIKTSICINGILIDVKTIQNKGSPLINIDIP